MGASVADTVLDQALQYIIDNADRVIYGQGEPSDYSEADTQFDSNNAATTFKLGDDTIGAAEWSGPAAGDTSGRKITHDKDGFVPDVSDDADHVAYVDDDNNTLLAVHEVDDGAGSPLSLTAGYGYNLTATDALEIRAAQTT